MICKSSRRCALAAPSAVLGSDLTSSLTGPTSAMAAQNLNPGDVAHADPFSVRRMGATARRSDWIHRQKKTLWNSATKCSDVNSN
jgi:hypothetical protein